MGDYRYFRSVCYGCECLDFLCNWCGECDLCCGTSNCEVAAARDVREVTSTPSVVTVVHSNGSTMEITSTDKKFVSDLIDWLSTYRDVKLGTTNIKA